MPRIPISRTTSWDPVTGEQFFDDSPPPRSRDLWLMRELSKELGRWPTDREYDLKYWPKYVPGTPENKRETRLSLITVLVVAFLPLIILILI
jgi:hypothetical protein